MSDTYCDKHKQDKRVMGGCSAHRSNWYCEACDLEREAERKIAAAGEVKMPSPIVEAFDEIDAALFTGDTFRDKAYLTELEDMLSRWQRGIKEIKESQEEELK